VRRGPGGDAPITHISFGNAAAHNSVTFVSNDVEDLPPDALGGKAQTPEGLRMDLHIVRLKETGLSNLAPIAQHEDEETAMGDLRRS